ncbi:MAG: ATP-binding cassette domain-containing protein [Chloroflexota bacterium]
MEARFPHATPHQDIHYREWAICCQGLSKRYGPVQALEGLTLAVPYGAIFGFLGRNGAGKTTTLRMLAGLAQPTAGQAWVAGLETTGADRLARSRLGYLPQDPAFYNWMTPREYLDYVGQIQGLPFAERKKQIGELLDLADLQRAAKRRIGGFSGGMLQRLGIAQALMGRPRVLLLDEPTSALDPAGRYEVLAMLAQLRGQATVFFSSHILNDVERICDTISILHQGKLVLVSGRDELLAQYAVDAVDLEFEPANGGGAAGIPAELLRVLQAQAWVSDVKQQEAVLRVMVQDVPAARREILPLLAAYPLALRRYEWVRPSLEEIFLQLSG